MLYKFTFVIININGQQPAYTADFHDTLATANIPRHYVRLQSNC